MSLSHPPQLTEHFFPDFLWIGLDFCCLVLPPIILLAFLAGERLPIILALKRSLSEDELRVICKDVRTIYGDRMGDLLEGMLRFSSEA